MIKTLAITSTLVLALAATGCSSNSLQGRAGNAAISAAVTVPLCLSVPIVGCAIGSFAVSETVNRLASDDLQL